VVGGAGTVRGGVDRFYSVEVRDLSSRHHPIVTGWWSVGGWPLSLMECWLSMLAVVQCVVVCTSSVSVPGVTVDRISRVVEIGLAVVDGWILNVDGVGGPC
jgi:hypothetical protein